MRLLAAEARQFRLGPKAFVILRALRGKGFHQLHRGTVSLPDRNKPTGRLQQKNQRESTLEIRLKPRSQGQ